MPKPKAKKPKDLAAAPALNRFDLYELAVQQPALSARFLDALHGRKPAILAEDFCGAAAIAREWVARSEHHRALATDLDPDALAHASSHPRLRLICKDVLNLRDKSDIVAAFNFALCELHTRPILLKYLTSVRKRLTKNGIAAFDLYGGPTAWMTGTTFRKLRGPKRSGSGRETIVYSWQQASVEPFTSTVRNAIHFTVTPEAGKPTTIRNAFVYHWRLWSVMEVREAMLQAGFETTEVHDRLGTAVDNSGRLHVEPADDATNHPDDFVCYVVGRV